jgi:uncharacterized membrane protein
MSELTHKPPRTSVWWRVALPISIVLNLFLVALIGGHLWRLHRLEENAVTPLGRALARAEASLPPAQAAAFGGVIRRDFPQYQDAAHQLLDAREALNRQMTAPQFNKQATQQALAAWRAAWNHFMDDFSGTLVDALAQVPEDGRRKLAAERRAARIGRVVP